MSISKEWQCSKEKNNIWLVPCEESYYIAHRWKKAQYRSLLDLGCGLGRHSIYFAKSGFNVSSFDLSKEGIDHLKKWAKDERLDIDVCVADMLELPYADNTFDCVFAYHVISHTDTKGVKRIIGELMRVLKVGGEFFITLCSKESWSYKQANYPKLDENTVVKTAEGPEKDVPHFYVTMDDLLDFFKDETLIRVRHIDDCYFDEKKQNSKHYFILGKKSI